MFLQTFSIANLISLFISLLVGLLIASILVLLGVLFIYFFVLWYRNRDREKESLESTLLQVALPRDNEIKIDAAEQLFSSLGSMRKGGRLSFLKLQPHLSFEIVGMPGDIRFYVNTPNKFKDLVEKQINGAYPDAEIKVVDEKTQKAGYVLGNEYNIFSDSAKVAFASLRLKSSNYSPIKVFKDLPTDPLSSITSVLAKMTLGEGAAIQILISPADSKWKKQGRGYIARTKRTSQIPKLQNMRPIRKSWKG
jgi:hypothetical protein